MSRGDEMKDIKVYEDHSTEMFVIYESNIDIGILPIVRWMNSLKGIMTRWSCEGDDTDLLPYITIWVEIPPDHVLDKYNDLDVIEQLLGKYNSVNIVPVCNKGQVHTYQIEFASNTEMRLIQKDLPIEHP